jgi:hypothetical protein
VPLPPAFNALVALRRFVTYELFPDPDRPGKTIKRPTDVRTGYYCKVSDPDHHYSYAEAEATGRPVGFVFMEGDGFWFADIDSCLVELPGRREWSALALELCQRFAGCAVEVSQSGTGLHIIGRGRIPDHSCRNIPLGLEFYHHERFVALTGTSAQGDAGFDASAALPAFVEQYFTPNPHGDLTGWQSEPVPEWKGPKDDADLLRAAMASGQKDGAKRFGDGITFADLWTADATKLAAKWPSDKDDFGHSEADAALVSHLAFWTGKNHERIRDLMWQSDLVRPKWEERPEYLDTTIMKATSVVKNVATGREPVPPPGMAAQSPSVTAQAHPTAAVGESAGLAPYVVHAPVPRTAGREYLGIDDQLSYFSGCVYITESHKVWIPSNGTMLDKARFDVIYGGYIFALDAENRKTTDSAFDALTRSRLFIRPSADRAAFRPEHGPGAIIQEAGLSLVNTYIPIDTPRRQGDAGPFIRHMEKLFPVARDLAIILNYMASLVQNPGVKFQWWPVIQGAEGNGKTLIFRVLTFAVGARYSHLVNPEAMAKTGNQFNSWIEGNLLLGVEEIYVNNRRDFLDTFKPVVTDDRNAMERKGGDQRTGDNRMNGILNTNHPEGVPITTDSRRYAIFYTPQQTVADLQRDGMMGEYFPDLYDWLKGRRAYADLGVDYGYSIVNEFLQTFPIAAELDPAHLCTRAPETSSTAAALAISLGRVEQEILEAVEEGRVGFRGGWISSVFMSRLLDDIGVTLPRRKFREILERIGYFEHPGLRSGRVDNEIMPDNSKPRLYTTAGHLSLNFDTPVNIAKSYTDAQKNAEIIDGSRFKR